MASFIDTVVTVLAEVSHLWDIGCTVAIMSHMSVPATIQVVDHDVAEPPRPDDLAQLCAPLTSTLTAELDEARKYLRVPVDEILLCALGRTVARTLGTGNLDVEVIGEGGVGVTVTLECTSVRQLGATEALHAVRRAVAASHDAMPRTADVHFAFTGLVPEPAYGHALPNGGHALELRVYRTADDLQMDWWYDTRRLDRYTVEELTEQFPLALIELTSEASPLVLEPTKIGDAGLNALAGRV
jgi:hypothetical protein